MKGLESSATFVYRVCCRSHPETLCSVPHRASDKAAPFLHRPFRFHVSGTQRTYSIMNLGIMPLTLAPKSAPDFRRECALTHSIAFGKNAQPAPERCRSKRVWDFPTSILQRKICICAHECTACRISESICTNFVPSLLFPRQSFPML